MIHELWVANDMADSNVMNWMMFQYRLRQDQWHREPVPRSQYPGTRRCRWLTTASRAFTDRDGNMRDHPH